MEYLEKNWGESFTNDIFDMQERYIQSGKDGATMGFTLLTGLTIELDGYPDKIEFQLFTKDYNKLKKKYPKAKLSEVLNA